MKVKPISVMKTLPDATILRILAHLGALLLLPPSMIAIQDVTRQAMELIAIP